MAKIKRPMVVEAFMTHNRTPFITEILKDGRTRKVGRIQWIDTKIMQKITGFRNELEQIKAIYGTRWTGIRNQS